LSNLPPLAPRPLERDAEIGPGSVLAQRFEIRALLGEGALGFVYRAFDREIEVEVALKVLRDGLLPTAEARKRFLELGAQVAKLYHPNLARVFRVDEEGLRVFFAMQLLEGLTLRELLDRRRAASAPLSIDEVEPFVSQIAAGLGDGHKLGPHGDLRPENVVVLPNLVKVTDFGVAPRVSREAFLRFATPLGGGGYLAPEVRAGGELTIAADVYSLGVIAIELLTGEVAGPGFRVREHRADLPESLESLLSSAIAEAPGARITGVDALARGVRAHVADPSSALSAASRTRGSVVRSAGSTMTNVGATAAAARPAVNEPSRPVPIPQPPSAAAIPAASAPAASDPSASPGPSLTTSLSPVTAVAPPMLPVEPDRTTVLDPEAAQNIAAQATSARRPIPISVWIGVILLCVAGATYGAIRYIDSQQEDVDRAMLAQQERDRAAIERERRLLDDAKRARDEAAATAARAADDARTKAEEAARAAKDDPAKKAEAERLAEEARKKEAERAAIEKKKKDEEAAESRAEAKEERKRKLKEKAEAAAREAERLAAAATTSAVTQPATTPPPEKKDPPATSEKPPLLASATVTPPEAKKPECPSGMARIKAGGFRMGSAEDDPMRNFSEKRLARVKTDEYCIDRFEFPNRRGAAPKASVNWNVAKSLCENEGKRLCTEAEWERACKGFKGLRFPYGDEFDDQKCNTETKAGEKRTVRAAGAFGGCRSGFGVFDMSGNVAEWTSTPLGGGAAMIIKGGAANKPDWAVRCANRGNKPSGSRDAFLGFRCCAAPK
jgi:serine/threonine protein kinase/formylglycine-generating enzyme required for sulfatase activity